RPAAAAGGLPGEAPVVVAGEVLTEPGERGGRAGWPAPPLAGPEGHPPPHRQLVAAHGQHVGVDARRLDYWEPDLAQPPAARPPDAQVQRPDPVGTPGWRRELVA